jgi:ribosomal protein S3
MSQKIVPKSLRLYNNKNWDAQWMANNINYSKLLFLDIEFKKYVLNIFKKDGLNLLDVQLKKNLNSFLLYIYINFEDTKKKVFLINKKIKIEQNLNNYLKKIGLKNSKIHVFITSLDSNVLIKNKNFDFINKFFKKMFLQSKLRKNLIFFNLSILTKNAKFLSKILCKNLERTPQHKKYLTNVYKILKNFMKIYPNFKGFKLQMKGRLNGIERARTLSLQNGRIPFNSLKYDIKYAKDTVITPYGSCSISVWFFFQ